MPVPETLFGSNVYRSGGEDYAQALKRQVSSYGELEIVRAFYPGLPAKWPGNAGAHGGPVVVSFKAPPQDVLAGKHDALFRNWFATAPRDRQINWTYFHEPEDDIERGSFTAADYRAAWRHLDTLAAEADNPQLKATTVFMCWTLASKSGRDWQDYYAGSDVIDEMGWDCYNTAWDVGVYLEPSQIFGRAAEVAKSQGKRFGIAEFGSPLVAGDDGTKRAAWLRASATWLRTNQAAWVTYFDAPIGREYRLLDASSADAWRWAVSGS